MSSLLPIVLFGQTDNFVKTLNDSIFKTGDIIRPLPVILFNLDQSALDHPSHPIDSIKYIADFLNKHPNLTVEVSNHADYRYSAIYSTCLPCKRAKTIVDSLIIHFGISPYRLTSKGYVVNVPICLEKDFKTPTGKIIPKGTILSKEWIDSNFPKEKNKDDYEYLMQLNRRTELKILKTDYISTSTSPEITIPIKVTKVTKDNISH